MNRFFCAFTVIILSLAASIDAKSSEADLRLLLAADSGNMAAAEKALSKGANPNFARYKGASPVLNYAARKGHTEIVKLLIKKGAALETEERQIGTCVLAASENGQLEVVKILVEAGANLNAERPPYAGHPDGRTALFLAAENGHSNVVSFLLSQGARVNVATEFDKTPLMLIAANGWTDPATLALEKKAQIDGKDSGGGTALMYAAMKGHSNMVRLLLAKGADCNLRNTNGFTALVIAAIHSHWGVVRLLDAQVAFSAGDKLRRVTAPLWLAAGRGDFEGVTNSIASGAKVNEKDPFYELPVLLWAARNGRLEIVRLFVAKGADVNVKFSRGWTALSLAAASGHFEVVKFLLENGANLNAPVTRGDGDDTLEDDALSLAVAGGQIEMVRMLLEKGAKVDKTYYGDSGKTLLHQVTGTNGAAIARLLIKRGARVDGRGFYSDGSARFDNNTPLMKAAGEGHVEVAKVLLENGANVEAKDTEGYDPLCLAASKGHVEMVRYLVEWIGKSEGVKKTQERAIWPAVKAGQTDLVSALLKAGIDPNYKDSDDYTLLMHAAANGAADVCKLLLDSGAKINSKVSDSFDDSKSYVHAGDTPLHLAVRGAGLETVAVLLENGANVNARNKYGETPLFFGNEDDAELLLGSGADPNVHDGEGFSPLFLELWNSERSYLGYEQSAPKAAVLVMRGADINESLGTDLKTTSLGAEPRIDYHKGSRPLHLAANKGIEPLVKLLLEKGANVNAKDDAGQTALSVASFTTKPLLLNAGAKE